MYTGFLFKMISLDLKFSLKEIIESYWCLLFSVCTIVCLLFLFCTIVFWWINIFLVTMFQGSKLYVPIIFIVNDCIYVLSLLLLFFLRLLYGFNLKHVCGYFYISWLLILIVDYLVYWRYIIFLYNSKIIILLLIINIYNI